MMVVVIAPRFQFPPHIVDGRERLHVQAPSRRRPLKDSIRPFSVGLPGRMKSNCCFPPNLDPGFSSKSEPPVWGCSLAHVASLGLGFGLLPVSGVGLEAVAVVTCPQSAYHG